MTDTEQPYVDPWPLYSKFPCLADIEAARVKLARRFNVKPLPKDIQTDLAWKEHRRRA
jgi:hypothetical protein